LLPADDALRA
jgi:hypothetical protein